MIIRKITSEGIYFTDATGVDGFLSFKECNENWLAYRKRTESLSDEQISQLRGRDITTGQRDVNHQKAYIEFFTRPFTRFEFENPAQMDEYRELRDAMHRYGWTTHDLS